MNTWKKEGKKNTSKAAVAGKGQKLIFGKIEIRVLEFPSKFYCGSGWWASKMMNESMS